MIKKLIYLNLVLAITLNWFTKNPSILTHGFSYLDILPKQAFGIVEVISILIFLGILPYLSKQKVFILPLALLIGYLAVSLPYTLIWDGKIVHFIIGVRSYVSFIPIFYGGYYLSQKGYSIKPYVILILILSLIQLPVTIFQYVFSLTLLKRAGTQYDVIAGTMGGLAGNLMSILLSSTALVLIYFYFKYKKKIILIGIASLIIPSILAEAKGVFIILFFGLSYFLIAGNLKVNRKIGLIFISIFLFTFLSFLYVSFIGLERDVLDPEYYVEYENKKNFREDGRVARYTSLILATELIASKPPGLVFGLGLGNAAKNNLVGQDGPFYSFFTVLHFWDRFIIETGFFGVFVVFFLIIKSIMMLKYVEKKSNDKFLSVLAGGMTAVMFVSIIAGVYTDHFNRVQYSYPLALIIGYIYSEYLKIKKVSRRSN